MLLYKISPLLDWIPDASNTDFKVISKMNNEFLRSKNPYTLNINSFGFEKENKDKFQFFLALHSREASWTPFFMILA